MITTMPHKQNCRPCAAEAILLPACKKTADHPWYSGILREDTRHTGDTGITVVDKGSSMEFLLPAKTAQFVEMSVLNPEGNLVWKTQAFNKNRIVWHKKSLLGSLVPKGTYTLRMKLGDCQLDGLAQVA
jgi:hypothetical protein